MKKLRYYLISKLFTKEEKVLVSTCISDTYYALNNYSENMGETHEEFIMKLHTLKTKL